jgi:uncharacterized membrane protein
MTLTALDNDADQRRGFPPSATVMIKPTDVIFSQSVTLPVRVARRGELAMAWVDATGSSEHLAQLRQRAAGLGLVLTDRTLRRIPVVGAVYNVADRFVGLLDQHHEPDIGAMSPVWCFFGGGGVAVLALAPNPQPIDIDGRGYCAVLIPTAPVPLGGALLYVPIDWVRPANIGADRLTAVYVSMGITQPPAPGRAPALS